MEQALENLSTSRNVEDVRAQVNALERTIADLKRELDPRTQRAKLEAAVESVSRRIAEYANGLRLEHSQENVRLNIRELTLQFSPASGRTDYLWEVGSGQNWVGYHVATLLALHQHFADLPQNPVPRFLMMDQPSQVYFPEAWPSIDKTPEDKNPTKVSSDIDGVRRIFGTLSKFMAAMKAQFQIIVTEHAGSITWDGYDYVYVVGNWRKGQDEFLIPDAWIQPPRM